MKWYSRIPLSISLLAGIVIISVFALILYSMGQPLICKCGYIKFWHGIVYSSENSQHITDWYTFSHIIHGFAFYGVLTLFRRKTRFKFSLGLIFIIALLVETGWEIFENTDFIINRYREQTISLDYFGDSVINSVGDVLAMVLGFFLAAWLPIWGVISLIIFLELWTLFFIRDNLTLNIIMLIYPIKSILRWQYGL